MPPARPADASDHEGSDHAADAFDPGLETGYLRRAPRDHELPLEIGARPFDPGPEHYDDRRARRAAKRRERAERKSREQLAKAERAVREREEAAERERLAREREAEAEHRRAEREREAAAHAERDRAEAAEREQAERVRREEEERRERERQLVRQREQRLAAERERAARAHAERERLRREERERIKREREERHRAELEKIAAEARERKRRARALRTRTAATQQSRPQRLRRRPSVDPAPRPAAPADAGKRATAPPPTARPRVETATAAQPTAAVGPKPRPAVPARPEPRARSLRGPTAKAGLALAAVTAIAAGAGTLLGLPVPVIDTSSGQTAASLAGEGLLSPSDGTPTGLSKGPYFPIVGEAGYGESAAKFGAPRGGRRHEGQDLFAKPGTPLVAVRDGTVVDGGGLDNAYSGGRGNWLAIYSPLDERTYVYLHLLKPPLVRKGDGVRAGQPIGQLGCTGSCYGPHLHFEVRIGVAGFRSETKAIDPLPFLKGWPQVPQ